MSIIARYLGLRDYTAVHLAMVEYTGERDTGSRDEIWFLEHPPVYTLGLAGRREHILRSGSVPIIHTDRGGQVTYHGPGQLVCYLLLDLRRQGLVVRPLVAALEQSVIDLLADTGLAGYRVHGAPGVYLQGRKIAALGIRIRRGCCFHGLSLNVDMDLRPFQDINVCGYPGLEVTQLADHGVTLGTRQAAERLLPRLLSNLGYGDDPVALREDRSGLPPGRSAA